MNHRLGIPGGTEARVSPGLLVRHGGWTLLGAIPLPSALAWLHSQLQLQAGSGSLAAGISAALRGMIPVLAGALVLMRALARDGLAETCLGLPREHCALPAAVARRIAWLVAPLMGASAFFSVWEGGAYSGSLGRIALMLGMFVLGEGLWTAAGEWRMSVRRAAGRDPAGGGQSRLPGLLAAALPMALVFLAGAGYCNAAGELGRRLVTTLLAGAGLWLLGGLLVQAVRMRQSQLQQRLERSSDHRQLLAELGSHVSQVLRLVQAGLVTALAVLAFSLWDDMLPIGRLLDGWHVWMSAGALASGDGALVAPWVTGRHVLLAAGIVALTLIASRNLPGLIQILLPASLPLDRGGRYAVTFVGRYLAVLVGLVQAAAILGFAWDRVQWLVAGLTVGLGFGLQEVFANLVSGIIILLERPVRVGDLVSVNSVTGTVTRMALRATTITDADRREWIIPNKKFITDDVMNWTLSDTVTRAVYPVAVAHGSDPAAVREILLAEARKTERILEFPEPSVQMTRICGTALEFELRVFLPSGAVAGAVQNDLLLRVERALSAAGIEIGLPAEGRVPTHGRGAPHDGRGQTRPSPSSGSGQENGNPAREAGIVPLRELVRRVAGRPLRAPDGAESLPEVVFVERRSA